MVSVGFAIPDAKAFALFTLTLNLCVGNILTGPSVVDAIYLPVGSPTTYLNTESKLWYLVSPYSGKAL